MRLINPPRKHPEMGRRPPRTHGQRGGVGVEDVDPELPQRLLEDHVHHRVLLAVLRLQLGDLEAEKRSGSTGRKQDETR